VRLALPFAGSVSGRQLEVLRAVAAAAALADPTRALQKVKDVRNPGAPVVGVDENDLAPVLDSVVRAQEDRSGAAGDARQKEVAQRLGVDSRLVVAALAGIEGNNAALQASLNWVANENVALLERAAVAANRRIHLIPDQQGRLQRLTDEVEALKADRVQLAGQVEGLRNDVAQLGAQAGGAIGEVRDRIEGIDRRMADFELRLGQLEAK
jgi:hypothetical protein